MSTNFDFEAPDDEPRNPTYIYNLKRRISNSTSMPASTKDNVSLPAEVEQIVKQMRRVPECHIQSVIMMPDQYISFSSKQKVLNDIHRFCVLGNSPLVVDTTFQLVDGLWLTDSSFSVESLLNEDGGYPIFPGPYMWHFKKNEDAYRRFALEMVYKEPKLFGIKKVGHDLDEAIGNGLTDVFQKAENLYCTEHLQKADCKKLRHMGANTNTLKRIMTDIYGCQSEVLEELGLADASDPQDFEVKLESYNDIWEGLIPGFHSWFQKNRASMFKDKLVMSARTTLKIKGRFYTNGLESAHRLQKKFLNEEGHNPANVVEVNTQLEKWMEEFYTEMIRAIRGFGKYRLAPGYEHFFVDPVKWNKWSFATREQHISMFLNFKPKESQCYKKPAAAGLKKAPREKRRVEKGEAEVFVDRASLLTSSQAAVGGKIPKLKLAKKDKWEVQVTPTTTTTSSNDVDPLNPDRQITKPFFLVHRSDSKYCPSSVKRCQMCKRAFSSTDWVLVKTEGLREFTTAAGKKRTVTGNVYIHYIRKCLSEYDQNFKFGMITVLQSTLSLLPPESSIKFIEHGCIIEE